MMKRFFVFVCLVVVLALGFVMTGCGSERNGTNEKSESSVKSAESTQYHLNREGRYSTVEADIVLTKIDENSYSVEYSGADAFLENQRHYIEDLSFKAKMEYYNSVDGYDCYRTTAPSEYGESLWYLSEDRDVLLIPAGAYFQFKFNRIE